MRSAILSVVALLAAAGSTLAQQPYDGSWSTSRTNCEDASFDGNISINGTQFRGHESLCRISKVTQRGTSWTLNMKCEGEGEEWNQVVDLSMPLQDRLARRDLVAGPALSYVRCPVHSAQAEASTGVRNAQADQAGRQPQALEGAHSQYFVLKPIVTLYYSLYAAARGCAELDYAFTEGDLQRLEKILSQKMSSVPQELKDEVWTLLMDAAKGKTTTNDECLKFKHVTLPKLLPEAALTTDRSRRAPF